MIMQMQSSLTPAVVGLYEYGLVSEINPNGLNFDIHVIDPTANAYDVDTATFPERFTQVIRVPQYTRLVVEGGEIIADDWCVPLRLHRVLDACCEYT